MGSLFGGYALGAAWDEMFAARGRARGGRTTGCSPRCSRSAPATCAFRADQLARVFTDRGVTFAYAGEERPFPLDLRAAGHRRRRVGRSSARRPAAGARAGGVPRRRLRRRPGVRRRGRAARRGHHQRRTSTAQAHGHRAAQRRAGARHRRRPGPRRGRATSGCWRTTCASRPGCQLRHREPARDDPGAARAVRRRTASSPVDDYPARLLAALRAAAPDGRRRPDASSCSPRASTTPPTSSTRCWPGRWASSWSRAATWSARGNRVRMRTTQGERPVARGLPPDRRRVPRPAALPARLGDRLPRHRSTRPGPATSPSPTRSATASPTTSCSTPTCPT